MTDEQLSETALSKDALVVDKSDHESDESKDDSHDSDANVVKKSDQEIYGAKYDTLAFLAIEAGDSCNWQTIYKDRMESEGITVEDVERVRRNHFTVQAELNASESKKREELFQRVVLAAKNQQSIDGFKASMYQLGIQVSEIDQALKEQRAREVVIHCWPYSVDADLGLNDSATTHDPVTAAVGVFGALWLIALFMFFVHGNIGGMMGVIIKGSMLLFLPAIGLFRGLTHIRANDTGLFLQSIAGKTALRTKKLRWADIDDVYVKPARPGKPPINGQLVIHGYTDRAMGFSSSVKIPLRKIASASQWRKLVAGLKEHVNVDKLDPALLDGTAGGSPDDPSYTRIWLDALSAAPKRERLQPLTEGVELQQGRYRIEKLIGTGGQGSAYLATEGGEKKVLKEYILPVYVDVRVKRQALEAFESEARLLCSLSHKGIVKCMGYFVEDHRAYLVLEYIEGPSLRDLVQRSGPLNPSTSVNYGKEMCAMLSYLHSQAPPIVHRDFTPDNLLVAPDGSLKLIDFMVAKQDDPDSASSSIVGKHHYMPPEQFRGKAVRQSDLYALGCCLHFLLTGCDPMPMSKSHPIVQNDGVSPELNLIVEQATELDLSRRTGDAGSILAQLNALTDA